MVDLELPFGIKPVNPVPVVATYGPWVDVATALANIPLGIRHKGLTAAVQDGGETKEYWFKDGILNGDFILKSSAPGAGLPNYYVPTGEDLTIPINKQHFTHGDFVVDGNVIVNGELVVTEGLLDIDDGFVDNNGLIILDPDDADLEKDVYEYPNLANFPPVGLVEKIYIDKSTNTTYYWNTSLLQYIKIGSKTYLNPAFYYAVGSANIPEFDLSTGKVFGTVQEAYDQIVLDGVEGLAVLISHIPISSAEADLTVPVGFNGFALFIIGVGAQFTSTAYTGIRNFVVNDPTNTTTMTLHCHNCTISNMQITMNDQFRIYGNDYNVLGLYYYSPVTKLVIEGAKTITISGPGISATTEIVISNSDSVSLSGMSLASNMDISNINNLWCTSMTSTFPDGVEALKKFKDIKSFAGNSGLLLNIQVSTLVLGAKLTCIFENCYWPSAFGANVTDSSQIDLGIKYINCSFGGSISITSRKNISNLIYINENDYSNLVSFIDCIAEQSIQMSGPSNSTHLMQSNFSVKNCIARSINVNQSVGANQEVVLEYVNIEGCIAEYINIALISGNVNVSGTITTSQIDPSYIRKTGSNPSSDLYVEINNSVFNDIYLATITSATKANSITYKLRNSIFNGSITLDDNPVNGSTNSIYTDIDNCFINIILINANKDFYYNELSISNSRIDVIAFDCIYSPGADLFLFAKIRNTVIKNQFNIDGTPGFGNSLWMFLEHSTIAELLLTVDTIIAGQAYFIGSNMYGIVHSLPIGGSAGPVVITAYNTFFDNNTVNSGEYPNIKFFNCTWGSTGQVHDLSEAESLALDGQITKMPSTTIFNGPQTLFSNPINTTF